MEKTYSMCCVKVEGSI